MLKEENERKKKYLCGYLNALKEEERIKQEIEVFRLRKMNPSLNMDGMPHSNSHSDLSGYMAKLDDLLRELRIEQEKAVVKYSEIRNDVCNMQTDIYREILTRKYLLGETLEVIAVGLNYSYKQICRLHGNALIEFKMKDVL